MAVSIRLRREGTTNRPYYKVVVADQRSPRDGKFIEIIGNYDPKKTGANASIDLTRADYWIEKGAQPSDTVRSLSKKLRKSAGAAAAYLRARCLNLQFLLSAFCFLLLDFSPCTRRRCRSFSNMCSDCSSSFRMRWC
jgi:small subunit ribosomal protein S16